MDINKDGFISRKEMCIFVMNFIAPKMTQEQIEEELVNKIFSKYDEDRNGVLNKRESLKLVNDVRAQNG